MSPFPKATRYDRSCFETRGLDKSFGGLRVTLHDLRLKVRAGRPSRPDRDRTAPAETTVHQPRLTGPLLSKPNGGQILLEEQRHHRSPGLHAVLHEACRAPSGSTSSMPT